MPNTDIRFSFKPSIMGILFILLAWLGSVVAILSLNWPGWVVFSSQIILFLYTFTLFYIHGLLKSSKAIRGLRYLSGNNWEVIRGQDSYMATLLGDSTATLLCCVLRFKAYGNTRKKSYLICCDSLSQEAYHRLLLQLRCFKGE